MLIANRVLTDMMLNGLKAHQLYRNNAGLTGKTSLSFLAYWASLHASVSCHPFLRSPPPGLKIMITDPISSLSEYPAQPAVDMQTFPLNSRPLGAGRRHVDWFFGLVWVRPLTTRQSLQIVANKNCVIQGGLRHARVRGIGVIANHVNIFF